MIRRVVLAGLVLLAGLAEAVADSPLKRLTLRQDLLGWEAVGRLDLGDEGFCSGALIAPDLVLTAAHCLIDGRTGRGIDPPRITFRAGLRDGEAIATRTGVRAVVHPAYDPADGNGLRQLQADVGLLELSEAIPAGTAAPFATSDRTGEGRDVTVVSFARGRKEALSWQRACQTTLKVQGVMEFTCDTDHGSSGAPIFDLSLGRPQIVSVVSRGSRQDGRARVFGPRIVQPLSELRHALRTGEGVWAAEAAPGSPGRQSAVGQPRAKIGARFVRP